MFRNPIAFALRCVALLLSWQISADAQSQPPHGVYAFDIPVAAERKPFLLPDTALSISYPDRVYADRQLSPGKQSDILKRYDPETSAVKLFQFYTLRYRLGERTTEQRVRVPYYLFRGSGTGYSIDSVVKSGDTFTFRFAVPADRGHSYELALNFRTARLYGLRYLGQGGAGNFTFCCDHSGKRFGKPVILDHLRPGGACYDLTPEYEGTRFIGRGIAPGNRSELVVLDEQFRQLRSYRLRYRIRSIEAGGTFYVIFDDPALPPEASEVKLDEVISGTRYLK